MAIDTKGKSLFQHNYVDVISNITPDLYKDTDYALFGNEEDVLYATLGKILKVIDSVSSIFTVSSTAASTLQQRFISSNNLTNIRPYIFDQKILKPLGRSLTEFTSKEEFTLYLSSVLLPNIHLNTPSPTFTAGIKKHIDDTNIAASSTHQYLLDVLSWFYVLNTSSSVGGVDPSSMVVSSLANIWQGDTLTETEGVSLIFQYLWTNRELSTDFYNYLPKPFAFQDSQVSSNVHTSGTQQWDNLNTLLGIWYNQHDVGSTTLEDYLDVFINYGTFTSKQIEAGAFTKFLQAVSFGFYDINSTIEDLGNLVDIENCPTDFLPHLASLIGWKLMTGDVDRWRAQLRKAVFLYKSKGTRQSLEDALELVFTTSSIIPTEEIDETWEMFLPRMIYYLIATESTTLNSPDFGPHCDFSGIPSNRFSNTNIDLNYRAATDYVLEILHANTPPSWGRPEGGCIYITGNKFDLATWDPTNNLFSGFVHRNMPDCPVPPWEDDRFYDNVTFSKSQVLILNDILTAASGSTASNSPRGGLGIPESYVGVLSGIILHQDIDVWEDLGASSVYHQSWNHKWKFYNQKYSKPPNLSSVIEAGDAKKIGLFDYWQSKSSLVTARVYLQDFELLSNRLHEAGIPASTDKILDTIQDVFKQFLPFHVINKIFEIIEYDETYLVYDLPLCVYMHNYSFDLSPSGDFDHFVLNNLIQSSTAVSPIPNVRANLLDTSSNYTVTTHASTPRSSGRRRNLKYLNTFSRFNRSGKAMPLHKNAALAPSSNSSYDGLDVHTSEFIPLGYNFSAGKYLHTSSQVYDASNDLSMSALPMVFRGNPLIPGTEYYLPTGRTNILHSTATFHNTTVSSTFPCRAPFNHSCILVPTRSDTVDGIKHVIIASLIRQGLTDDFGDKTLNNYKFGETLMKDFYNTSGVVLNSTYLPDTIYDGGIQYSEKELKIIYSHFNEMVSKNATRLSLGAHASHTEIYQTSGGGRGSYIDPYGTDDPGTYGLATSGVVTALAGVAGVLFNLNDD